MSLDDPQITNNVATSGGELTIDSRADGGAHIEILFSSVAHSPSHAPPPPVEATRITGLATILVVEDEKIARMAIRAFLEPAGYRVLEAARGDEALQIAREEKSEIRLLLCDINLPDVHGPDLFCALNSTRPDLAVIFMSGYSAEDAIADGLVRAHDAFLAKPIDGDVLVQRVGEILDSR